MKKQLSMLALLVGASLNAQAAQSSFFKIEEVDKGFAIGISGDNAGLVGVHTTNNMSEFFSSVRFADFLVDRFNFIPGCQLAGDVCDTFWDEEPGYAHQWRVDFLNGVDQRSNVSNFGLTGSETVGLVTGLGEKLDVRVGYEVDGSDRRVRTAFATLDGITAVALKDGSAPQNLPHSLSVPTAIKKLTVGPYADQYLVSGTAATGKGRFTVNSDTYEWCYAGNDDDYGDYESCPGLNTQASFWLLNGDGTFNKLMQAPDYGHDDDEVIQTASARGVVELNGSPIIYGVGYSSTGEWGSGDLDGRNLASYWTLDLNAGSVGATQRIPLPDGEPGDDNDDSSRLQHSWAVGVNANGYVIGNQRWNVSKGQNFPVEMFLFDLNTKATASIPLQDKPLKGSGSEAAAINDHNMVVGWRDSRHQTQPVDNGTNRMQEAFLLNAASPDNNWYLNDLICGLDDAGAKQCAQGDNGYYYHIAYASGISADGTIAATAYRYNSESDLNNRTNATVVAVMLTPSDPNMKGYENIPAGSVVSNPPVNTPVNQDSGGGGLFWLTLLALPFAWLRRNPR